MLKLLIDNLARIFDKTKAVLLGLTFFLSIPAVPLGYGFTTSRFALALLIFLSFAQLRAIKKTPRIIVFIFGAASISLATYQLAIITNTVPKQLYDKTIVYDSNGSGNNDGLLVNLYSAASGKSANQAIWMVSKSDNSNTLFYKPTSDYGNWNENTVWRVVVPRDGFEDNGYLRFCMPPDFDKIYGTTRRLSAKIKMLKGDISSLSLHNRNRTLSHDKSIFNILDTKQTPADIKIKEGWYKMDVDVSGDYPNWQCVGIGMLKPDVEFLVTEIMLYNSAEYQQFTPIARGTITVTKGSFWITFSWILLGLTGLLMAFCVSKMNIRIKQQFVWTLLVLTSAVLLFILYNLTFKEFKILDSRFFIRYIESIFPVGLNRNMNTLVVLSGIFIGALIHNQNKKKYQKLEWLIPGIIVCYFILISGSRQSMMAFILIAIINIFIFNRSSAKSLIFIGLFCLFVSVFIYALDNTGILDTGFIINRFSSIVLSADFPLGPKRMFEIQTALNAALIGGVGPGNFPIITGLYPHNGYLYFLAEAGLIKGGIALLAIWGIIIYTFIKLRQKHDLSPLARSAWVVFLVLATVMNMFNDLFREPIFWATLGLAVGASAASPLKVPEPKEEAEPVQ